MNREGYAAPSSSSQAPPSRTSGAGAPPGTTYYICAECGLKLGISPGGAVRCSECGHRVLYKQRTKRMVQFEAR